MGDREDIDTPLCPAAVEEVSRSSSAMDDQMAEDENGETEAERSGVGAGSGGNNNGNDLTGNSFTKKVGGGGVGGGIPSGPGSGNDPRVTLDGADITDPAAFFC